MNKLSAFDYMTRDAIEMLGKKEPGEIEALTGIPYDAKRQVFQVVSLGKTYTFHYPEYSCEEEIETWQYLTVLHYMNLGDGTPVAFEPITFSQMPAGMIRGTKFDQTVAEALKTYVSKHTETEVREAFESMGGEVLDGRADLSVRLWYLPRVPITVNIWFADEEFPPSVRMLADKSIEHYFSIEDAVTVGECILRML